MFQEANLPFSTLFFVCYSSTFKLLLCYYQYLHFDWSEERRDWAKISFAGQLMTGNNPKLIEPCHD